MLRYVPLKRLTTPAKEFTAKRTNDFFGICDITSKDIAGCFKSLTKLPHEIKNQKYDLLIKTRYLPANEERLEDAIFGKIRVDSDNQPQSHGQYEPSNTQPLFSTIDVKQKYMPELIEGKSPELEQSDDVGSINVPTIGNPAYRISEVEPVEPISTALSLLKSERAALEVATHYRNSGPLKFYFESEQVDRVEQDELNFGRQRDKQNKSVPRTDKAPEKKYNKTRNEEPASEAIQLSGHKLGINELEESIKDAQLRVDTVPPIVFDGRIEPTPLHELEEGSDEYIERLAEDSKAPNFDKNIDLEYDVKPVVNQNAMDYLKSVRKQRIEPTAKGLKHRLEKPKESYPLRPLVRLDSKGYHNYEHQVPSWWKCSRSEILQFIRNSILYNNYDILAINKPYGIASHEEDREKDDLDMNSLVQEVAKSMKINQVRLAHRLDKNTTGVLLFSTSQRRASNLQKLFKSDQIKKTYLCITTRVPEPTAGVIDIPIGEYTVAGKTRCVPVGEFGDERQQVARRFREARRAITEYNVLATSHQAALVEVKPRTGVKHQIRCHLGFALSAPILGDHKYSHIERVAPQQLTEPLLKMLHLRQTKVRTLPMHLHAYTVVIPNAKANGETLFIEAPFPAHFKQNLKSLKLELSHK